MNSSLLTTLSFLLLLSSTKLLLAHSGGDKPVLDIHNKTVSSGFEYFIEAVDNGFLNYINGTKDVPCPFAVALKRNGARTNFFPIDGSTNVTESTNLLVHYKVTKGECGVPELSLWKVNTDYISSRHSTVVGVFLEADPKTHFQIKRAGHSRGRPVYKFVNCSLTPGCLNLVLLYVEEVYRLFVEKSSVVPPAKFVFKPATPENIKLVTSN